MRVAHIVNHIQKCGNGVTNVVVDLACLQAKSGHNVIVVAADGEYQNLLRSHGVNYFRLEHTGLKRRPIELIKVAWRYRKILREFQPDIVHAHQTSGLMLAQLFRSELGYNLVSTVHCEFERGAGIMGRADRVIAVSDAVAQSMLHCGVPHRKLQVVSNGTLGSPRTLPLEEYLPVVLQRPAIVTIAGIFQRKGIAELIDAFEQIALDFSKVHLYIVGDGPNRSLFEAKAESTSVADRIHFEGFQPDPQPYLLDTDIFVLASHRDPSPLVISEAREASCAIVASNVDGIPEALDDGQAGILVPPSNSSVLASALKKLLSNGDALRQRKNRAKQNLERLKVTRVNEETLVV